MNSVNLVPVACQERSTRRRRIHAWTIACVIALVVVGAVTLQFGLGQRAVGRVRVELSTAKAAQTAVKQQLEDADRVRGGLIAQGRAVTALRRSHALHTQLAALSQSMPDGVVFTRIEGRPAAIANRTKNATSDTERPPTGLSVEMTGYAIGSGDLTELTRVLRQIPDWNSVTLRRAAREPYLAGEAIAFQIECVPSGATP